MTAADNHGTGFGAAPFDEEEIVARPSKISPGLQLINYQSITAIHSISTNTSLGKRDTSTQARAGAVASEKY